MKFPEFETAVIELASEGTPITTANVVAHLKMRPATAEAWLDKMAKDGRLDVDVDEEDAVLVYRVKGLTVKGPGAKKEGTAAKLVRDLEAWEPPARALGLARGASGGRALAAGQKKSVLLGALIGLVPGLGLFYAAPFSVALVASVAVLVVVGALKILALVPLLGGFIWFLGVGALVVVSALLGAMYAHLYNQHGRRTNLGKNAERKRLR
ncbi:MAG: hypothetical protein IT373_28345 [Polyangiaceae bacterium]|nr:hypothetical protein [Polyangiaceae bacterium]